MKKGYYDRLIEAKDRYGDIVVAEDKAKALRYSSLLSGADAFCERLAAMGIKAGDHVALCGYNSCAWLCAFFGTVKLGAVAVLMNYSVSADELAELYGRMDCRAFLFGSCSARNKNSGFASFIEPDAEKVLDIDTVSFPLGTAFVPQRLSEEQYSAPAFSVFTSGSTGLPKGALLTQRSSVEGADAYVAAIPEMAGERLCLAVPLFHIFGLGLAVTHLLYGGSLILPSDFSNDTLFGALAGSEPDSLAAVMTVTVRLTEDNRFPNGGYPSIRRLYTGGAPLMPIQLIRIEYAFRGAVLLNSYGQTEVDASISMTRLSDSFELRSSCVGKPLPHRKVVIMSSAGEALPAGEVGEITVYDDGNIMKGYYGRPRDQQPIDENGYLHTGDLGFLDAAGYLHLAGRSKDIIIKGGENIVPSEIEAKISTLAGVREVKVMGAPNDIYGESIEACVTSLPGFDLDPAALKAALKGKVSGFKLPAHFFLFDSFPLKANGKPDLVELKVRMLRSLNALRVEEDIVNGIPLLSISAKSQKYIIEPICRAVSEIVLTLGFTEKKAMRIVHCFEEIINERSNSAYMQSGELRFELRLRDDFMRVCFTDEKPENMLAAAPAAQSLSTKIILAMTDRISRELTPDGKAVYCLDYLYDKDFDAREFFEG